MGTTHLCSYALTTVACPLVAIAKISGAKGFRSAKGLDAASINLATPHTSIPLPTYG